MSAVVIALLMLPLLQAESMPVGDTKAGAAAWRQKFCHFCHGDSADGGYGPDIAGGRGLTWSQFQRALRRPFGAMPRYTEGQLPEQMLADLYAFVKAQKPVAQPSDWHWQPAPSTAALGQRLYMQSFGCGQCHEPENKFGRMWLGEYAKDVTFEYFATQVYDHTKKWPKGGMPTYSRDRLPESSLREVYKWMVEDLGMRASIGGSLTVADRKDVNTTYNLTIANRGVKDKGLAAETVTVFVKVPSGTKVVSGTGTGYQGVLPLAKLGLEPALQMAPHPHDASGNVERPKQDLSGDVIVWKVPRLSAADKLALSFTLSGAPPSAELHQGFNGSTVHWEKPGRNAKGKPPIMVYRDLRSPDEGDHERIPPPPVPPPAQ